MRGALVMELYDESEGLLGSNDDGRSEARESVPVPMVSCGQWIAMGWFSKRDMVRL
jgi:hypothetical protein